MVKPNGKTIAFIIIAMFWILFASGAIDLYFMNNLFNFNVNIFGMVMTGLLLWGLEAISIWTLLAIFALNISAFFLPIMRVIVELIHPYLFGLIFSILKIYVIYKCFCHVFVLGRRVGRKAALASLAQQDDTDNYEESTVSDVTEELAETDEDSTVADDTPENKEDQNR